RGFTGFCRFARVWRWASSGSAAGKMLVGSWQNLGCTKRFGMIGKFFAERGNLFGCDRAGAVAPFGSLVAHDVGDLFISQSFVPRLHHSGAELLAFNGDRTLQAFEDDHGHTS